MNEQTQQYLTARLRLLGYGVNRRTKTSMPPAQPRRQSLALVAESGYDDDYGRQSNPFTGSLHPSQWKALANRRNPWPQDCDPDQAVSDLCSILTYRIMEGEAAARGRRLTDMMDLNTQI